MRAMVVVFVAAAACGGGDDFEFYPVNPGGGGGGALPRPDAAPDGPDMGGMVSGKVCAIADARNPQDCSSGAGGVMVSIGAATATTASDGTFMINRPAGATLWLVSGTGFAPSAMRLQDGTDIPLLDETTYTAMVDNNSPYTGNNTGWIIAKVKKNGQPAVNTEGTTTPDRLGAVYYDTIDPVTWETDTTEQAGAVWITGVTAGTVTVQLQQQPNPQKNFPGIPVVADAITWMFATI